MFCAEDRALICRRCDLMIHTANEFTKTHHRYILSGFAAGLRPLPEPSAAGSSSFAGEFQEQQTGCTTDLPAVFPYGATKLCDHTAWWLKAIGLGTWP